MVNSEKKNLYELLDAHAKKGKSPLSLNISHRIFSTQKFLKLSDHKRAQFVGKTLLDALMKAQEPTFLLPSVLRYFSFIYKKKILESPYTIRRFELWLNQQSNLDDNQKAKVRAKIVGKYIPRDEFGVFFPLAMEKKYEGSHFISAHESPDLDTVVASFLGWLDAFGAQVSKGRHIWNIPGGKPNEQISRYFDQFVGKELFSFFAYNNLHLQLHAKDLYSQKGMLKAQGLQLIRDLEHGVGQEAIVLVDKEGYYLGDWRSSDVEGVRQIISLFNQCLRYFENILNISLVKLLSCKHPNLKDYKKCIFEVLHLKIRDYLPFKELSKKHQDKFLVFIQEVLGVEKGLESTVMDFAQAFKKWGSCDLAAFISLVHKLEKRLFDASGRLKDQRTLIFKQFAKIIHGLDHSVLSIRNCMDRLDLALLVKKKVLRYSHDYVNIRADLKEVQSKMQSHLYLTVVYPEKSGKLVPLGIILSQSLREKSLATISLRDFCNRQEVKIDPQIEVISVIDHHKAELQTTFSPTAIITDSQSTNVLIAEKTFILNDAYSVGGLTLASMRRQLRSLESSKKKNENGQVLWSLQKKIFTHQMRGSFWVHPSREILEYAFFLYAILDDTDLLSKVSKQDLLCVTQLLNRLRSLLMQREVQVINLQDLVSSSNFVRLAKRRILENPDMYSIYKEVSDFKKKQVDVHIKRCMEGKTFNLFDDVKDQNACARVGQTKILSSNYQNFLRFAHSIKLKWLQQAMLVHASRGERDLHLHMISTIASAKEVYASEKIKYKHLDQIWLWIPSTDKAQNHLASFLSAFRHIIASAQLSHVDIVGKECKALEKIFEHHFTGIKVNVLGKGSKEETHMVINFDAGLVNSRKGQVTPCLPKG